MAKKDYREKIEEDRQEIGGDDQLSRLSRSKRKTKKRKSPLMSILLVVFILIPLSLLVYVKFFYVPTPQEAEETVDNETVQMETNDVATVKAAAGNEENEKSQTNEAKADAEEKAEEKAEDVAAKEAAQKAAEEKAKKEAEVAAAKKAEQQAAAKKAAEEAAAKKAAEQQAQSSSKSHVVGAGDTLYSIAMKYYGDPNAVGKIKAANNLSSDSIPAGRTLILP